MRSRFVKSNQSVLDILYSSNAKGYSNSDHNVLLNFERKMAQLVLNVAAGDGVSSLAGVTAEINGLIVEGGLNLTNGEIELGTLVEVVSLPIIVAANNTSAVSISIVLPAQDLSDATIRFTLNGQSYSWSPATQVLNSGMRYTYSFQLSTTGLTVMQAGSSISEWDDDNVIDSDNTLTPLTFSIDARAVSLSATASLTQDLIVTAPAA